MVTIKAWKSSRPALRRLSQPTFVPPHISTRRSAFTFVELSIAVLVAGILLSVAYPRWAATAAKYRADAAAKRVAQELGLVSTQADATSQPILVEFLLNSSELRVQGWTDPDRPTQEYRVSLPMTHGATITSASFNGQPSVTFNGFGIPSAAGVVVVQAGNYQATVTMDAAGRVTAP